MFEVMIDGKGYELESGEPFFFACCDCGLVHRCVVVSEDGKPVGVALERNAEKTEKRRAEIAQNKGMI